MKKLTLIVLVLVAIGVGAGAYYMRRGGAEPQVTTLQVTRGDVIEQVGATGTLQAVTTVQVGTQVSGIVDELYADFNSIVKKGQIIARLDPSILQTQVETAKANLANAEANLERQRVALQDANTKLKRARELATRNLIPQADLETAEVTAKQAEAQLRSTESQIVQARAAVNKAQVDLNHTIITAPIDGIVISRNVDRGQTVAASMQAPTLFIIAADLAKMQVNANIDESDVGRMRPGQVVHFRVDAYPTETFTGTVQQVRLNPTTVQNVVTYSTVIDVPNPDLKLKPGMTANVNIEIAHRTNVLRVPNAALRFRPTRDTFQALNQPITPDIERALGGAAGRGGFGRGGQNAANTGGGATAARGGSSTTGQSPTAASTASQGAVGRGGGDAAGASGGNMDPEERRKRMEERMAQMTPEQRERFQARLRDWQARGGFAGRGDQSAPDAAARGAQAGRTRGAQPGAAGAGAQQSSKLTTSKASTIDSLFGPLPATETRGRVWLYINNQLKPVNLRLGISDGTWTEVTDENGLQPGIAVVTNLVASADSTQRTDSTSGTANPLMGPQRRGGQGGGGNRGGGR